MKWKTLQHNGILFPPNIESQGIMIKIKDQPVELNLLQEEMMYSDKFQDFKSLISIAPHSAGMPEEAPGQVGNWMGWQIVKAYMKRHPETTLPELIKMKDVQEILTKSRYKPKR